MTADATPRPKRAVLRIAVTVALAGLAGCSLGRRVAEAMPPPGADGDVVFRTGFESPVWYWDWGSSRGEENARTVVDDPSRSFEPLEGRALRVRIARGTHAGTSLAFRFDRRLGAEPDEIYLRYYLRLADDWTPVSGGKLPGIAGTYDRAGWGGRAADGANGWSARGTFGRPRDGATPIGFYVYHADMEGRVGSVWYWDAGGDGLLERNRWYCIEQHVKLNDPGRDDGVLRGWIDGALAFERRNVRFRTTDELRIDRIWIDVYHGGKQTAVADHHLYLDDLVVSRSYVGPRPPVPASCNVRASPARPRSAPADQCGTTSRASARADRR